MAKAHQRLVLRKMVGGVAAALLLLTLVGPAGAARGGSGTASLHVALRYDAATLTWNGSFRAIRSDGAVIARGSAVDRSREQNGVDWLIGRRLTTRKGTLRFSISGPVRTPISRLRWLVVGGTGAYAAVQGQGIDVERAHSTTATAVMHGVPLP
jgi:hypothetical protein